MNTLNLTVSDANVLIDMEAGGLEALMFELPCFEFHIPNILFEKELRKNHSHFEMRGLKLLNLSGESVAEVVKLSQIHHKPSRMDLFALVVAKQEGMILLTGDKNLRIVAQQYDVRCHGTIWLVEKMIDNQIINSDIARMAYLKMRSKGSRLPWDVAERSIKEIEIRLKC